MSIKKELRKQLKIIWNDQIQQFNKLQVFKLMKPDIEFESYLTQVKNVKHRQAATRFRISAHKLAVETGRYTNIERNLRLCSICNLQEIGDEYHYFSNCENEKLKKLRKQFLKELIDINCNFSSLGSNELFLYCVSMNDENIINPTAKYIYEILKTFDTCF